MFKFKLFNNGKLVGFENHVIDPDIGHIGIYHKNLDEEDFVYGYPITMGDKYYIFHDRKELIKC